MEIKGDELDGILITHEHSDHIQGSWCVEQKDMRLPIYATPGTIDRNQRVFQSWKDAGRTYYIRIQTDETFTTG